MVGDGRGQVGFTTAISTDEDEPSLGVTGIVLRYMICLIHCFRDIRSEVFEAFMLQITKIGYFLQLPAPLFFALGFFTFTGNRSAKVWVPKGHIGAQVTRAFADLTDLYRGGIGGGNALSCWFRRDELAGRPCYWNWRPLWRHILIHAQRGAWMKWLCGTLLIVLYRPRYGANNARLYFLGQWRGRRQSARRRHEIGPRSLNKSGTYG